MKPITTLLFLAIPILACKPNVVYLMSDGWPTSSPTGQPSDQTPVIDQFAREGIRFTKALAVLRFAGPCAAT